MKGDIVTSRWDPLGDLPIYPQKTQPSLQGMASESLQSFLAFKRTELIKLDLPVRSSRLFSWRYEDVKPFSDGWDAWASNSCSTLETFLCVCAGLHKIICVRVYLCIQVCVHDCMCACTLLYTGVLVCEGVCACLWVWEYTYVYGYVWQPEVSLEWLSSKVVYLVFWGKVSHWNLELNN